MKRVEHRKSHLGFTLIEMALVLGVIALVLTILLPVSVDMLEAQERKDVVSRLSVIDSALVNFVVLNRRLPCPADGTLATGVANAGLETLNAATGLCNPATQITGVVPWVTLGIAENTATDPWGSRITYRVAANLANATPAVPNRLMDMSWCDPVGTAAVTSSACTAGCTGAACTSPQLFLSGKGLPVSDGNGNWLNNPIVAPFTGAAYVLISHGPSGTGAYINSGNLSPGSIAAGTSEILNQNNRALMTGGVLGASYRDAPLVDAITLLHFDDYLSHPTIMSVLQNANLGPRAH
ncbi:MAG: type II secretion system protein [Rhodocyclaceae bacterium]|nr:type II secretion system protein [Rhodocyclaceae bacterium]MBP6110334.1 type II secretion system protein [Rhodocyclaceae bacterium]